MKIPIDLRKVDKSRRSDLNKFWNGLSETQQSLVNLISNSAVNEYQKDYYKNYR